MAWLGRWYERSVYTVAATKHGVFEPGFGQAGYKYLGGSEGGYNTVVVASDWKYLHASTDR